MYYPNAIEEVCFDQAHIEEVWDAMNRVIPTYFQKFIETEGGNTIQASNIEKLVAKFGSTSTPKSKTKDNKKILESILKGSIKDYEQERQDYLDILNLEALDEYKSDVNSFKNTILKNQIPIIRKTLQNKQAKELDKFRLAFANAQPGHLFEVTTNIIKLAYEWSSRENNFEKIDTFEDLNYQELDNEKYTAFGVIGGGIKSHFIYRLFPNLYPNRNRESVWALYYLSNKKKFDCKEDSEFLMINVKEGSTQQNYFYPYGLFAFYAVRICNKLKEIYAEYEVIIPAEYRFVVVDNFLSFVARSHQNEIDVLKQKSDSYHYDY